MAAAAPKKASHHGKTARPKAQRKATGAKTKYAEAERGAPKAVPMSFRIDDPTRDLVDRAATVMGQNRTDFMLTVLREKATEVLLNQRLFTLEPSGWDAFVERLDDPPPPNAKLKALLLRAPAWDK